MKYKIIITLSPCFNPTRVGTSLIMSDVASMGRKSTYTVQILHPDCRAKAGDSDVSGEAEARQHMVHVDLGCRDNKHDTGIGVSQTLAVCLQNHVRFPPFPLLPRRACAISHVSKGGHSLISEQDETDQRVWEPGLFFVKWRLCFL